MPSVALKSLEYYLHDKRNWKMKTYNQLAFMFRSVFSNAGGNVGIGTNAPLATRPWDIRPNYEN